MRLLTWPGDDRGKRSGVGSQPGPPPGLADAVPALLWISAPDGGDLRVNAAWLELTGMDAGEAAGDGWLAAVHPDDRGRRLAAQREAAAAGEPFEVEYRLRRHDGGWRWVLDRGHPAGDAYAGACFDVTERRAEAQELLRSREDLRLALAAGNMGTWVWDRRTGTVTRDRNLQVLYGLHPDAAPGSFDEWVELVHPDDRERVLDEVERAVAESGTYELEHRVVRPDGEVRWLARRGAVYYDDGGRIAGTRGVVVDVTERKRAEEERNRLLAAEQEARRVAEAAAERVARLLAVTAGLADARTARDVADVVVAQGVGGLGADSGALCLLHDDGHLHLVRHLGYDASVLEQFQSFAVDAPLPASEAVRTGELVLLPSQDERDRRFPALRGVPARNRSYAVVPLVTGDRRFGAVALGWRDHRPFDEDDRRFLTALGQQAAQALDRAQFHAAEQARARRQSFLAEASRLLGSTLDYAWALGEVARLAVPGVVDRCSVHLVEGGAVHTVVAAPAEAGEEVPWPFSEADLLEVAASGRARLVAHAGRRPGPDLGPDDHHPAALADPGSRSALAVALGRPGEPLGVVALGMDRSGRSFGPDDVAFAEDLAGRATAAIVNSRSHRDRTVIAHTLQASLLPPDVPVLPGLEVAARYRPVGHEVEVGGDFYDVFAAGGGRWGVVIGDVSGKGVPAATVTALARYTVRTAARGDAGPSDVLDVLNSSILDAGVSERFCTVALAFLRLDEAGVHFTLACGGQPPPLLVDRSGDVRPIGLPGTAIGLFDAPKLTDVATRLGPEELLVLYTDGVVEARSPSGQFADGLLEATLRTCAGLPAEAVADAIEQALLDFTHGQPRDDTAILVIRRPGIIFHEHLVPGPRAVPRARQRLRDWLHRQLPHAPELAGDVLMLANELATNAERAARSVADVHVTIGPDAVTVDVSDDGPGFGGRVPPLTTPPADAVAGRGLHIVSRLADEWIVRSTSSGTLVRAVAYRPTGSLAAPR